MAQLVEHRVHIAGVTGSSPVATITKGLRFHFGVLFFEFPYTKRLLLLKTGALFDNR